MEDSKTFEKDPAEGEPWEPTEKDDTQGIKEGDRIRLTDNVSIGEEGPEGTVIGFSKKFGIKQVRVRMDGAPADKVFTFELGRNMEKI